MNHRKLSLTVSALCLAMALGCAKKSDTGKEGSTGDAKATSESEPCKKLGEKLCTEVGKETPSCEAAKMTLELLSDRACSTGIADFAATKTKLMAQGKKCDELVAKLCAALGPESQSCALVRAKTKDFPPAQCSQMLGQVDDIVKELKQQEKASQPLGADVQAKLAASDAPSFGPANAKVTVVEFSDFQCPYCSKAAAVANQVKAKYSDKVRFVFRQFPLSFHQNAQTAAEASLAANAQGKFWALHDKMFANQQALERAALEGYAKDAGLDVKRFKDALDSRQYEAQVKADMALGSEAVVQGTPSLFVNGQRVNNPTDFDEVSKAIEAALGS